MSCQELERLGLRCYMSSEELPEGIIFRVNLKGTSTGWWMGGATTGVGQLLIELGIES